MPDKRGFVLDFRSEADSSLVYHGPDYEGWTEIAGERGSLWCHGELLGYRTDDSNEVCLRQALADWEADKLEPTRLNGRFTLIFQDIARRAWEIVTDRLGAMHSYGVFQGERLIEIGSHLGSLRSSHELDWFAIATFFAFGFFLDDRTYYSDTRILLPHSIYRLADGGKVLAHRRYWQWHHTVDPKRTYHDAIGEYDRLLRQAVQRATAVGKVALPLSGGLDSRSLAAVIAPGTLAYSYGYSANSIETHIASQVAQAQQLNFAPHVIRPYLFDRFEEIVLALHGSQDVTQARQCSVNAWVHAKADTVLTGLWGDVWCDQMGLADGLPEGLSVAEHTLKKFQKRGRSWLLDNLCKGRLNGNELNGGDLQAEIAQAVTSGLGTFQQITDLDFRVKAYKTSRWAFRWSNASLRGFALGAMPRVIYYDVDLIDFFCALPTAFVRDRRLQVDHLKQYTPDLARIRWQAADANLYLARYGRWIGLPRRGLKKIQRQITGERVIQRNWEVNFLTSDGRAQLTDKLMYLVPDFIKLSTLEELIARFYQEPDAANGYTVSMLATFAGWINFGKR